MPQKLRKSKVKRKIRQDRKPTVVKEVNRVSQPTPSSKPVIAVKPTMAMTQLAERNKFVFSDLKRSLAVAGVLVIVLIILYLWLG